MTLGFTLVVILMGAVVRATGSGAGCGRSWPACQGEIVPPLEGATAVEFAHRGVSGVALLLVAVLVVWVFRATEPGHPARGGAVASLVAIIGEALIGAAIVLFEWVADDASVARAVSVPLHLLNTFVLLAALTLTAYWLGGGARVRPSQQRRTWRWVLAGGVAVLLLAGTGAITALADTLFPKGGAASEAAEHFLSDLRIVHPILAVAVAGVAWVAAVRRRLPTGPVQVMGTVVGLQLLSGVLMISLGVPLWLQILHLALADLLWITYVLTCVRLLGVEEATVRPAEPATPPPS